MLIAWHNYVRDEMCEQDLLEMCWLRRFGREHFLNAILGWRKLGWSISPREVWPC
jgi:hypothetical protein